MAWHVFVNALGGPILLLEHQHPAEFCSNLLQHTCLELLALLGLFRVGAKLYRIVPPEVWIRHPWFMQQRQICIMLFTVPRMTLAYQQVSNSWYSFFFYYSYLRDIETEPTGLLSFSCAWKDGQTGTLGLQSSGLQSCTFCMSPLLCMSHLIRLSPH